jgi:hypothetical protein
VPEAQKFSVDSPVSSGRVLACSVDLALQHEDRMPEGKDLGVTFITGCEHQLIRDKSR